MVANLIDTNLNTGEQEKGVEIYFLCYTKKKDGSYPKLYITGNSHWNLSFYNNYYMVLNKIEVMRNV